MLGLEIRGEGRSCSGMKTVKRVGAEDGTAAVEYGDAGGWDLNDTVKFIRGRREGKGDRDDGRSFGPEGERRGRISDEKLPMITDAGAETAAK